MPARGTTRGRAVLAAAVGLLAASSTAGVEAADDPSKCSAQEAAVPGTLTYKVGGSPCHATLATWKGAGGEGRHSSGLAKPWGC